MTRPSPTTILTIATTHRCVHDDTRRRVGLALTAAAALSLPSCGSPRHGEARAVDIANAARAAEARVDAYAGEASAPRASPISTTTSAIVDASYRCADGRVIAARFDNRADDVSLRWEQEHVRLSAQPHADGIAYAADGWRLRGKGRSATLTAPDGTRLNCTAD